MHKYPRETEKTLFYGVVLSKDLHHALGYLYLKFLDIPRGVLEAYYEVRFLKYDPLLKKFDYITWKSHDTVEAVGIYSSVSKIDPASSFSCIRHFWFTYKVETLGKSRGALLKLRIIMTYSLI